MTHKTLKEFIARVIRETREEDIVRVELANKSYSAIFQYIKGLGGDLEAFERAFKKDEEGYLLGIALGAKLRREEHTRLYVEFLDTTRAGVDKQYQAAAQLVGNSYKIYLYFTAPTEVLETPESYNLWLAENLGKILNRMRGFYVHEFIHTLDFRRMSKDYLYNRKPEESVINSPGYFNAPIELNGFYSQGLSVVVNKLKRATTQEEKEEILGKTPQEFAERFVSKTIHSEFFKLLTPENKQRILKRIAVTWEVLRKRFTQNS